MTTRMRLFPLNAVLFPGAALNLHVFEARYKQLVAECLESGEGFGVVLIREGKEAGDPSIEPHDIGTLAEIVGVAPLPLGRFYLSAVGRQRFHIRRILKREPYLTADVDLIPERLQEENLEEIVQSACDAFAEYDALVVEFTGRDRSMELSEEPDAASFAIADALQVGDAVKQRLLEFDTPRARLTAELALLRRLLPRLRELLDRRAIELETRRERGADKHRSDQERHFGKYFSAN